jgi:Domain of unknown function (DUF4375)
MTKAKLTQKQIDSDPNIVWNSFIDVIGGGDDPSRSPLQQHCHYCFRYYSEVQNGGHLQFFENNGLEYAKAVLESMNGLGLVVAAKILQNALSIASKYHWPQFAEVDEYVEFAQSGLFDRLDNEFSKLEPRLIHSLEQILMRQRDEFIEVMQ